MSDNELFDIRGKVAVVTGGTRGIGYMIAEGLVKAGVRTYVVSRKAEACVEAETRLKRFGEAIGIAADLSDITELEAFAAEIRRREPRLHILVNNAGATWGAPLEEFPVSGWDKVMNLNVRSIFFLTQKLIPALRAAASEDDPARVINIGSVDGLMISGMHHYPYSASKAALHHLTRQLAKDLGPENISVNAIAPGPFETKMMAQTLKTNGDAIVSGIPRRRIGKASDAAGAVIFLSSAASSYVTGAVLPLDGGLSTTR
jgi:NAD(P)-dependent dehydrogenase (short-subunit alcohol dehydrogenase family)